MLGGAMGIYFWIVYWGAIIFGVVVCWRGDTEREPRNLLDRIKHFFLVQTFSMFRRGVQVVSPSMAAQLTSCEDVFFNKPNRTFAGLYWVLFLGGYVCFVMHGFDHIPNRYCSEGHKWWGSVWVFLNWAQFIHLMYGNPGRLTKENIDSKLDEWEYDDTFYEAKWCATCSLQRPARAKHCRVCNHCVSRFDHHCIWINTCVGQNNQVAFLLFLLNHAIVMMYIAYIGSTIVWSTVMELDLFSAYYFNEQGQQVVASYTMIFHYVLKVHPVVFSISMFTGLLSFMFGAFLGFQSYLVCYNLTTNEFFKWGDIKRIAKQENRPEWIPTKSPFSLGLIQNWLQLIFTSRLKNNSIQVVRLPDRTAPQAVAARGNAMNTDDDSVYHDATTAKQKKSQRAKNKVQSKQT